MLKGTTDPPSATEKKEVTGSVRAPRYREKEKHNRRKVGTSKKR